MDRGVEKRRRGSEAAAEEDEEEEEEAPRLGPLPEQVLQPPTCSEFESGTSPQELDSTCAPFSRHQSMHLMACSRLPLPSAFMKRQGRRVATWRPSHVQQRLAPDAAPVFFVACLDPPYMQTCADRWSPHKHCVACMHTRRAVCPVMGLHACRSTARCAMQERSSRGCPASDAWLGVCMAALVGVHAPGHAQGNSQGRRAWLTPVMPMPLLPTAPMTPATCVPCPCWSITSLLGGSEL